MSILLNFFSRLDTVWVKSSSFPPRPGERDKDVFQTTSEYAYDTVYDVLKEMLNDDALTLAFNTEIDPMTDEPRSHPSLHVLEELPVAPNNVRPPPNQPQWSPDSQRPHLSLRERHSCQ